MDLKQLITGFLSETLKLDNGKIEELLNDVNEENGSERLKSLLDLDKNRIDSFGTTKFQEGFKKDKKEFLTNFENEIKHKFNLTSANMGFDLIEEAINSKVESLVKENKIEINDENVKKHSAYLALEKKYNDDTTTLKNDFETQLNEIKTSQQRKETRSSVFNSVDSILSGLGDKIVMPKNEKVRQNQISLFKQGIFNGIEFENNDGVTLLVKDGKRLENGHGHALTVEQFVSDNIGNYFETSNNNGGQNSGSQGSQGGSKIPLPKSEEEYLKIVNDKNIPLEERKQLAADWTEANPE